MSSALRPCPFCGSESAAVKQEYGRDGVAVGCNECKGAVGWFYSAEEATNAWNKREEKGSDQKSEICGGTEMKYDDAIKLFENCPIACGMTCEALAERTCGYCALQRSAETILDALRMAQGIANPQPLTLEQLKEMEARPVYIVYPKDPEENHWDIYTGMEPNEYDEYESAFFTDGDYENTMHYSEYWLAYAREPKEG